VSSMMDMTSLVDKLNVLFKDKFTPAENGQVIYTEREYVVQLMKILKDQIGFRRLGDITSVDYEDRYEVVYNLMNDTADLLAVKVKLDKNDSKIPTVSPLWKAADTQEREVYDLMGIIFEGHGNLKRILCPDDFVGHPLQKGFKLDPASRFKSN
jgi:NADH-quinone oxidoreductase subunit C